MRLTKQSADQTLLKILFDIDKAARIEEGNTKQRKNTILNIYFCLKYLLLKHKHPNYPQYLLPQFSESQALKFSKKVLI